VSNESDRWFSTDYATGVSSVIPNSQVSFFVDAEEYYADLRREVEATGPGNLICWV
jgi:hypothetical protein